MSSQAIQVLAHIVVLLTIPLHECAHGLVSLWLGDRTAQSMGRLTLNPLRHLDVVGTLCLLVVGVGWAKPVPIDPRYYKNPRWGTALCAAAGPAVNLLMAYILCVASRLLQWALIAHYSAALQTVVTVLLLAALVNINLAVFNLLPVPPFDGSRMVAVFLPGRAYGAYMKAQRWTALIVFVLVFSGLLDTPLGWLNGGARTLLYGAASWVDGIGQALFF